MEISGVTNGSWLCPEPWCFHFFSDSSLLCLYTHSLCFAINQLLRFALSLAYLFQIIIIILPDSSLLQPSYYYHLSNLYITYITSFVLLSCISLCTLIPNKAARLREGNRPLLDGQNRPPVYTIIVICTEYLVNRYADDFLPCNM